MKKIKEKDLVEKVGKKTKTLVKDFKSFAIKGSVLDLAVGVIIGTAFTKIVNSLVTEIITPLMSLLTGKVALINLFVPLSKKSFDNIAQAKAAGVATINYGVFISSIVDFLIVAFTMFLVLRYVFKKNKKEEIKQTIDINKNCPYCLSSIPKKATTCAFCTKDLLNNKI